MVQESHLPEGVAAAAHTQHNGVVGALSGHDLRLAARSTNTVDISLAGRVLGLQLGRGAGAPLLVDAAGVGSHPAEGSATMIVIIIVSTHKVLVALGPKELHHHRACSLHGTALLAVPLGLVLGVDQGLQEVLLPSHPLHHLRLGAWHRPTTDLVCILYPQFEATGLNDVEPAAVLPAMHDLGASEHLLALASIADLLHKLLTESHQRAEVCVAAHGVCHKDALLALQSPSLHARLLGLQHSAGSAHCAATSAAEVPHQIKVLELARFHGQRHKTSTSNDLPERPLCQQCVAKIVPRLEPHGGLVASLARQLHLSPSLGDQEENRTGLARLQDNFA
mmetsp:Transcript_104094/g.325717  ORF Transcript_104094/g.325717 Transcript_104094/m.325717 type:complete len:336 (-) Transcript_104094:230-1237(-)